MPSSPSEQLANFISGTPPPAIRAIAAALETGGLTEPYLALTIRQIQGVTGAKAQEASAALVAISGTLDPHGIACVLRTSEALRYVERLDRSEIEIAWTGPRADGPLVRPTHLVIEEMLRGVRECGEILLVGYSLTTPSGSAMGDVITLLEDAARRRARVTLVLHKDVEAANLANVRQRWDAFVKKPRVMTWDPPAYNPYTKLHAKALIVDRVEMLVGSANFTFHGLESNLELGLRVRGPQAGAVAERFDYLMAAGVIRDWE